MFKKIVLDGEITRWSVNEEGQVRNDETGKFLKGSVLHTYRYINFRWGNKQKNKSVHRIVAETFLPNPDNLPYVHHIDGNRLNNKLTISLIILFTITTLIESNYYPYQDLYISTPLLSSLIFIYALNNPNKKANKLSKISEEYSLYIYIFHYYIIKIISYIIYPKVFRYYCKSHMILIPVIIISTILLSYVYKKIKEKMKVNLHFS